MRALLLGDIHTERELLDAALDQGDASAVDLVLSVGDIVDGPHDPVSCIQRLQDAGAHVVRGNHERWVLEGHPMDPFDYPSEVLAWLGQLPATRAYDTPTGRLLLGHGIGDHDMARLDPSTEGYALECLDPLWTLVRSRRYRWLIGGHTHVPMVRTIEGLTIINPGTLVAAQEPGVMIADFARAEIEHWRLAPTPNRVARWQL